MNSRLIDQPTIGFDVPKISQQPATPITSPGTGLNAFASPTFSAPSTSSPFKTIGPALGGLLGLYLANRDSTNNASTANAGNANTAPVKNNVAIPPKASNTASNIAKATISAASNNYSHPQNGTDSMGNLWKNGEVVQIPSAGLIKISGVWYDSNGNVVDYSITGQETPTGPNLYDSNGNLLDPETNSVATVPPPNATVPPSTPNDIYTHAINTEAQNQPPQYQTDNSTSVSNPSYDNSPSVPVDSTDMSSVIDYYPSYDSSNTYDSSYDTYAKNGGAITMMKKGGLAHFANGGSVYETTNGDYVDSNGQHVFLTTDGDYVDSNGNIVASNNNTDVVNSNPATTMQPTTNNVIDPNLLEQLSKYLPQSVMDMLNSAVNNPIKTALGVGTGAAIGNILSNMTQSSGGVNQGVDMSKVGYIAPHTTTFGMGPARYVGYDQYGTSSGPDIYADTDLYKNLGTPKKILSGGLSAIQGKANGGPVHFTYGQPVDPMMVMQGMRDGGTPEALGHPEVASRMDFRQGSYVHGPGDGQSDDIPAMLADGEYVFDADTVAALGNGSSKAGAEALDKMRESIRAHKRSAPINKIPPPAKSPLAYLKGNK
jgi:hypothetical protein